MVTVQAKEGMPHLFAGLIASGLVAVALFAARLVALDLEPATIRSTAPKLL